MELERLKIGEYEEGDIDEIIRIERDSYLTPWSENLFRCEMTSPISRLLVGRTTEDKTGGVVGYVVYWRVDDEIHLHNIAVRRDMRRKGIASRLLEKAISGARMEGGRWITLEVRRSNEPAQRMYEKFGFAVQGVRPGYYTDTKEDALIMSADLRLITLGEMACERVGEIRNE